MLVKSLLFYHMFLMFEPDKVSFDFCKAIMELEGRGITGVHTLPCGRISRHWKSLLLSHINMDRERKYEASDYKPYVGEGAKHSVYMTNLYCEMSHMYSKARFKGERTKTTKRD
jgi:hypothetical protein